MEINFKSNRVVNIEKIIDNSNNQGDINLHEGNLSSNQYLDNKTILEGIDLNILLKELNDLKLKLSEKNMLNESNYIKEAINAKGVNERVEFLKKAGKKALELSKEICLPIATSVLTKLIGL